MKTALEYVNISAYLFVQPQHRPDWGAQLKAFRELILAHGKELGLKGTILLAPEGINLFVSSSQARIESFLGFLRANPALEQLQAKQSPSESSPFRRLLVKIKKEIIAFGVEGIDPARHTAPHLSATELASWLDQGRPLILLDTRNDYEVKLGTFVGAIRMPLQKFREFPAALDRLPAEYKQATVVSFCTGGIRCEKAAALMLERGYQDVYQLDGGILKYFELVGARHYQGECFVFDGRVGLDPALHETDTGLCFACQAVLEPGEMSDPRFRPGLSCPHCYRPSCEILPQRQQRLLEVTRPLPGSVASTNLRPVRLPGDLDGQTWATALTRLFRHIPPQEWRNLAQQGLLLDCQGGPADLEQIARAGQQLVRVTPEEVEPEVSTDIRFLYEDESLIVLSKPAPLPMHSCGRFHRNTLRHFLNLIYAPDSPRPAHRLDANTTGLVVCARTHRYAKKLQDQFAQRQVEKFYLAKVLGHPPKEFEVDLPISSEVGQAGRRQIATSDRESESSKALEARTHFKVLEYCSDQTAIVQAKPVTGRTNQIRIHLAQAGYPILGDHCYPGPEQLGDDSSPATLGIHQRPLHLHAFKVAFLHPRTHEPLKFEAPCPWWPPTVVATGDFPQAENLHG